MISRVQLEPGQVIRVIGPAHVRVISGQVLVLGAVFDAGKEFFVHQYRSYAIKGLVESLVEIRLESGGSLENPLPGEEIIDKWVSVIDSLIQRECRRIVVIGPSDSGKTSIAALIANRSLLRGYKVGVIDADVGQADIGPPSTVSAAMVPCQILWLRELRAQYIRFIGSITPQRNERKIVAAVVELANRLIQAGADTIVVDTDGWVQGINSIEYKAEITRFIKAHSVVVVGDQQLYQSIKNMFQGLPCGAVFLESPRVRRERSREDRRVLRKEAYKRYLTPLFERVISLDKVSLYGSCFFSGRRLRGYEAELQKLLRVNVLAVSETIDTYYVVTSGQPLPQHVATATEKLGKQVYILDVNLAKNAVLSIIGSDYEEKAIGLLKEIDFDKNTVTIATPYTGEVRGIIFGSIRLSDEFEEVGKPLRCVI